MLFVLKTDLSLLVLSMKAKFDYRYLAIWLCVGNIVQFITDIVGEDRIKSIWSGKVWIFAFIFLIPYSLYLFSSSERGKKFNQYMKSNETALRWFGNSSLIIYVLYFLHLK